MYSRGDSYFAGAGGAGFGAMLMPPFPTFADGGSAAGAPVGRGVPKTLERC